MILSDGWIGDIWDEEATVSTWILTLLSAEGVFVDFMNASKGLFISEESMIENNNYWTGLCLAYNNKLCKD